MQRQHSSQATSTLGNTPNLNIGSLHQGNLYIGSSDRDYFTDKSRDVRNALISSRQKAVEENRNRLSHIIRTIEFCGRQEMPLRGHRDAGAFSLNETVCNDGVFKAALRLRVEASDKQTSDLFLKAPRNVSYLSWRVQNKIYL